MSNFIDQNDIDFFKKKEKSNQYTLYYGIFCVILSILIGFILTLRFYKMSSALTIDVQENVKKAVESLAKVKTTTGLEKFLIKENQENLKLLIETVETVKRMKTSDFYFVSAVFLLGLVCIGNFIFNRKIFRRIDKYLMDSKI